jgi:hypothetical protein
MVHVESSRRLTRVQAKYGQVDAMGYVEPCYPYFVIFFVLDIRDVLVFYSFGGAYK